MNSLIIEIDTEATANTPERIEAMVAEMKQLALHTISGRVEYDREEHIITVYSCSWEWLGRLMDYLSCDYEFTFGPAITNM